AEHGPAEAGASEAGPEHRAALSAGAEPVNAADSELRVTVPAGGHRRPAEERRDDRYDTPDEQSSLHRVQHFHHLSVVRLSDARRTLIRNLEHPLRSSWENAVKPPVSDDVAELGEQLP